MASLSLNDLHQIFENLDRNGDGLLTLDELSRLLNMIGHKHSLEELESSVGKSCLDLNEFLLFYDSISEDRSHHSNGTSGNQAGHRENIRADDDDEEINLLEAFRVFDLNGDGYISSEELQSVLLRLGMWDERSGRDCGRMISAYDTNRDGRLDFKEFKNMMLLTIS